MDRERYVRFFTDKLFEREEHIRGDELTWLIEQNQARGNPADGFLLGGKFHTKLPTRMQRAAEKKLLHADLMQEGRDYVEALRVLETEKKKATQGLTAVLYNCMTDQDVRDQLTDVVAKQHPDLAKLSRVRLPGFLFAGQALQWHLFQETMDLLEYHYSNAIL